MQWWKERQIPALSRAYKGPATCYFSCEWPFAFQPWIWPSTLYCQCYCPGQLVSAGDRSRLLETERDGARCRLAPSPFVSSSSAQPAGGEEPRLDSRQLRQWGTKPDDLQCMYDMIYHTIGSHTSVSSQGTLPQLFFTISTIPLGTQGSSQTQSHTTGSKSNNFNTTSPRLIWSVSERQ